MDSQSGIKNIIVHLGPHKTGSTAIQKSLSEASDILKSAGVFFLQTAETHGAALDLANERFEQAEARLCDISRAISHLSQDCVILSQEDFCGPLIGRSAQRKVYPKLTKNMRILKRALRPHRVRFVFYVRDEAEWLRSCYHQHLKFRTRFHRFEDFADYYGQEFSWATKLEKPSEVFGQDLAMIEYCRDPSSGIRSLLKLVPCDVGVSLDIPACLSVNPSPAPEQIERLERINEMSEFGPSSWFSKSLFLKAWQPETVPASATQTPIWPPTASESDNSALPKLLHRSNSRVSTQSIEDILPPADVDLEQLALERLPADVEMPKLQRSDIRHQAIILNYHLRGKSKLNHLNALAISYLRRDTEHTPKARTLFHRIWREQGVLLVNELSTRWLISTLQTFLDHGENEAQRSIGTAGYFYANMMKIYEGERAIEGREQDAPYSGRAPTTKNKFRGLDRYDVGGTDLMLNTNALALELAHRDDVAGLVLQEFLLRTKSAETVFSRHDRTRKSQNINVPGFKDVWTFFDPWDD